MCRGGRGGVEGGWCADEGLSGVWGKGDTGTGVWMIRGLRWLDVW